MVLLLISAFQLPAANKPFPKAWGPPPKIQTQDYVKLPHGFGHGSSTLKNWINQKVAGEAARRVNPIYSKFPKHWGAPPRRLTRDHVQLPGGYGMGSSTLARWIKGRMALDAKRAATKLKPLYQNDLSNEKPGELSFGRFMVLGGEFTITETAGNKLIELPGAPLESFGTLFGPNEATNVLARAKIFSTNKKRRYPAFGLGLNGVGGYRLQVSAAKRKLELFKRDDVVAQIPYRWQSGKWTWLEIQVRKTDMAWCVEGRAWVDGEAKPANWLISFDDKEEPFAGMAGIWGQPYAGTPIQFDELAVFRLGE